MWTTRRIGSVLAAGLLAVGCTENNADVPTAQYRGQVQTLNGFTYNGFTYNGFTYNGFTYNGITYNGFTYNGITYNGITYNGTTNNGITYNGITYNGFTNNGITYNGVTPNGITYNGITYNGPTFTGPNGRSLSLTIEGSQLKGIAQPGNKKLSGDDFVGMTMLLNYTNSDKDKGTLTLRIDDAHLDTSAPFNDIWQYRVSISANGSRNYQPVCLDENGQPTDLVLLVGMSWDFTTGARIDNPKAFTLACNDGALEKCVHLGYRPWANATTCSGSGWNKRCTQVPLKDHHQACTRMLRADYCGNGQPWTLDGTLLDIYDYLQPPIQLQEENWQIESRWVPTGATCLSEERHPELGFPGYCTDSQGRKVKLPKCQCYDDNRGLIVSTFNDDPKHKSGK